MIKKKTKNPTDDISELTEIKLFENEVGKQFVNTKIYIEKLICDSLALEISNITESEKLSNLALSYSEKIDDKLLITKSLSQLGRINLIKSNFQIALDFFYKALDYNKILNNQQIYVSLYNNIGVIYLNQSDLWKALEFLIKSIDICKTLGDKFTICRQLTNIAAIHTETCNYPKAIESLQESLKISNEINDLYTYAASILNLGNIYYFLKDYDNALDCFEKYIQIETELNNPEGISRGYNNIGLLYIQKKEFNMAKKYIKNVLKRRKSFDNTIGYASTIGNLGMVHLELKEYDNAIINFKESLEISSILNYKIGVAIQTLNLGHVYSKVEFIDSDLKKAKNYFLNSIDLFKKLGVKERELEAHFAVSELYELSNKFKDALEHLRSYYRLKEEISNEDVQKKVRLFAIERKTLESEKEKEIAEQKIKYLEQLLDSKQRELLNFAALIVEKTEFVNMIVSGIEKLTLMTDGYAKEVAINMLNGVKNKSNIENDWKIFHHQFLQLNQDFASVMNHKFPQLTSMELKLCALLKMQIASKDIAEMLNLSLRNIENHRYRLRKKFNLEVNESLTVYLAAL
jgi:tetratricopeptide (TPR) repeat protein